jgi:hypothetical protein
MLIPLALNAEAIPVNDTFTANPTQTSMAALSAATADVVVATNPRY